MINTALVVISDGRGEYLERTLSSAASMLLGSFSSRILVDDSGDADYAMWLDEQFGEFRTIHHGERRGFGAAIKTAWSAALEDPSIECIWHLEEDFVLNVMIDVAQMAWMLKTAPIAQFVLKRQPWSQPEIDAGGQIELAESEGEVFTEYGERFVAHRRNFSTNPSLLSRRAAELCLAADIDFSEPAISKVLLDNGLEFAYWGKKSDPPRCHHIGANRSGTWRP